MYCCVTGCKNDIRQSSTSQGITFHVFPMEPSTRAAWLITLDKHSWDLEDTSAVCSEHFSDDVFEMMNGVRKLKTGAVPMGLEEITENDCSDTTALKVCRICLATDCKLYPFKMYGLEQPYGNLIGIPLVADNLPQNVCSECYQRLLNSDGFRNKSLKTNSLLNELAETHGCITLYSIGTIDRETHQLKSKLSQTLVKITDSSQNEKSSKKTESSVNVESFKNELEYDIKLEELQPDSEYSDSNAIKACRICLATEHKLFSMKRYNLGQAYANLTGIVLKEDSLPQDLCPECCQRLLNRDNLRNKSIKTNILLYQLAEVHNYLNLQSIKTINRESHQLNSTLSQAVPRVLVDISKNDDQNVIQSERPPKYFDIKVEIESDHEGFRLDNDDDTCDNIDQLMIPEQMLSVQINSDQKLHDHAEAIQKLSNINSTGNEPLTEEMFNIVDPSKPKEKKSTKKGGGIRGRRKKHEGPYPCEICGKVFKFKKSQRSHLGVHTGDKLFSCEICGKKFNYKSSYNGHLRIHIQDKPFSCPICAKTFKHKKSMKAHWDCHTTEKPFTCEYCQKKFARRGCLNKHIRTHTGEKPYPCDICKKSFSRNYFLKAHIRTHTGERPFSCDICNKRFNYKISLKDHIKLHNSNHSYFTCGICKQIFKHIKSLKSHLRTHPGEDVYSCSICKKDIKGRAKFLKHVSNTRCKENLVCDTK